MSPCCTTHSAPLIFPTTQCLGRPTAACWSSTHSPAAASRSALTVAALARHRPAVLAQAVEVEPTLADVLAGGTPSTVDTLPTWPLYAAGHADGVVRLWGMASAAPNLAALVPAPPSTRSAAVTAVAVCAASGMLAVGRASGVTDLFQFLPVPRLVVVHTLLGAGQALQTEERQQAAGFQHVLRVAGEGEVGALALASRHRLLAVGDKEGGVAVVDLSLVCCFVGFIFFRLLLFLSFYFQCCCLLFQCVFNFQCLYTLALYTIWYVLVHLFGSV